MRYPSIAWFAFGFAAAMLFSAGHHLASAKSYSQRGTGYAYVVAESRYGNATVRGPVRQTSLGPQVRLPGGSWVYCKRSCSETLRAETVDFWEAQRGPAGKEQGLLIYLRGW